jgi:hypothetical protein
VTAGKSVSKLPAKHAEASPPHLKATLMQCANLLESLIQLTT